MMYEIVYLFVICAITIGDCGCVNVTMNIKYNGSFLNCHPPEQINMMEGDEIQLVTTLPDIIQSVNYILCYDSRNFRVAEHFNITKTNECIASEPIRFTTEQQGRWECSFYFQTKRPVKPFQLHMKKNFTAPICQLNFKAVENLWFTGLDADRRIIKGGTAASGGYIFMYTYETGERLNITCQSSPDSEIFRFELSDRLNAKQKTNLKEKRFEKIADESLDDAKLVCQSRDKMDSSKIYKIQLNLKSKTPVLHAPPTMASRNTISPKLTTKAPISVFEKVSLKLEGIHLNTSRDSNDTHLVYNFNEPQDISMECVINKDKYTVTLLDGVGGGSVGARNLKNTAVSYNFTLGNYSRLFICKAIENSKSNFSRRILEIRAEFKYEAITYSTPEFAGNVSTFLESYWPIIVICCTVILIICVITCLANVLCARNKSQPPDDHVNLTSDRDLKYAAQTAPNQSMPIMQSNYCNPKDLQGRRNNIEPNYSEVKEAQGMGEVLYAELSRPEDTYAEPYVNKNELYAQPIPKAERRKKDDPNYSNVFGQDYVNSRK